MQLSQLHMVKQILETGSLSKTALHLNWAQSVVSRQLAAFENECGGRIFYRNGRGVVLTELGERIMPLVDTMITAAEEMTHCGAELRNQLAGEVKVSVGPQIAPILSGPLFQKLKEEHPNIRLTVSEAYASTQADLKEARSDVAVFIHNSYTADENDQIIAEIDNYLVGLPDSPALQEETIRYVDALRAPLLLPSMPNTYRRAMEQVASREGFELNVAAEVNAPGPAVSLVRVGAGQIILPLITGPAYKHLAWIGEEIRAGHLRASRIVGPASKSTLYVSRAANSNRCADAVAKIISSILNRIMDPGTEDANTPDDKKLMLASG